MYLGAFVSMNGAVEPPAVAVLVACGLAAVLCVLYEGVVQCHCPIPCPAVLVPVGACARRTNKRTNKMMGCHDAP